MTALVRKGYYRQAGMWHDSMINVRKKGRCFFSHWKVQTIG